MPPDLPRIGFHRAPINEPIARWHQAELEELIGIKRRVDITFDFVGDSFSELSLGANFPEDAVYSTLEGPTSSVLHCEKKYVLHFPKGPASSCEWLLVADPV